MLSYDMPEASWGLQDHALAAGEEPYTTPDFRADRPYVLVADDTYDILSVVLLFLESEGYAGVGFVDSCKIPRYLEEIYAAKLLDPSSPLRLPSVILLDLMMPGLSGYELASWLSQQACYQQIPLMIMTAHPSVRCFETIPGVIEILGKPFHFDLLLSKIEPYITY